MKKHPGRSRRLNSTISFLVVLASIGMPHSLLASEPGTIGIAVNQLYSEQQPTKRGPFMVRRVEPSSAAADAGIQPGDLIIETDGKPVAGIDSREMIRKRLQEQAGVPLSFLLFKPTAT
jgi:S1-C subfamily serine protease